MIVTVWRGLQPLPRYNIFIYIEYLLFIPVYLFITIRDSYQGICYQLALIRPIVKTQTRQCRPRTLLKHHSVILWFQHMTLNAIQFGRGQDAHSKQPPNHYESYINVMPLDSKRVLMKLPLKDSLHICIHETSYLCDYTKAGARCP